MQKKTFVYQLPSSFVQRTDTRLVFIFGTISLFSDRTQEPLLRRIKKNFH